MGPTLILGGRLGHSIFRHTKNVKTEIFQGISCDSPRRHDKFQLGNPIELLYECDGSGQAEHSIREASKEVNLVHVTQQALNNHLKKMP